MVKFTVVKSKNKVDLPIRQPSNPKFNARQSPKKTSRDAQIDTP